MSLAQVRACFAEFRQHLPRSLIDLLESSVHFLLKTSEALTECAELILAFHFREMQAQLGRIKRFLHKSFAIVDAHFHLIKESQDFRRGFFLFFSILSHFQYLSVLRP